MSHPEPYIDVEKRSLRWFNTSWEVSHCKSAAWEKYSSFERIILENIGADPFIRIDDHNGYCVFIRHSCKMINSKDLIGYTTDDYVGDDENIRIKKRSLFLFSLCDFLGKNPEEIFLSQKGNSRSSWTVRIKRSDGTWEIFKNVEMEITIDHEKLRNYFLPW